MIIRFPCLKRNQGAPNCKSGFLYLQTKTAPLYARASLNTNSTQQSSNPSFWRGLICDATAYAGVVHCDRSIAECLRTPSRERISMRRVTYSDTGVKLHRRLPLMSPPVHSQPFSIAGAAGFFEAAA